MTTSSTTYRADIDGLRAIAILTVIGFHFFANVCPGGYFGVDVFFVISGYLITDLIQKRRLAGTWHITEFWARRIRRIFPSLLVMFLISSVIAHFALYQNEARDFSQSLIYGALFWSNMFLRAHSGYFDMVSELRANLHLWSLAIEEQFYLLWPFVIALTPARFLRAVALVLFAGSLAFCIASAIHAPNDSFYLIWSRFWELAAGGLLALFSEKLAARKAANLASALGFIFVLAATFVFAKNAAPGWRAILPVAGAALIIYAGPEAFVNRILAKPILVWIGLISYPLYLWHWILLYFVNVSENLEPLFIEKIAALALAVVLSFLCYRFVEKPIRRVKKPWALITWFLFAANFAVAGVAYLDKGMGARHNPSDGLFSLGAGMGEFKYCPFGSTFASHASWCTSTAFSGVDSAFIGDSHAQAAFPGIVHALGSAPQWVLAARSSCPSLLGVNDSDHECQNFNEALVQTLQEHKEIKTVVILDGARMIDGATGEHLIGERNFARFGRDQMSEGLIKFISAIQSEGRKIVFVIDAPAITASPQVCMAHPLSFRNSPGGCAISRTEYERITKGYREIVEAVNKALPQVIVVDPTDIFCDQNQCAVMHDGKSYYSYSDHMSDTSSILVARRVLEKLK